MRNTLLLFLFLFPLLVFSQIPDLTSDELKEDVQFLQEALYECHANIFRYYPKDTLDHYFETFQALVDTSVDKRLFENQLREVITKVGCVHTMAFIPKAKVKKKDKKPTWIIPFKVFTDGDKLWIADALEDSLLHYKGVEILAINGRAASSIVQRLRKHQSADGYNTTFSKRFINRGLYFNLLTTRYYGLDSLATFSFSRAGKIEQRKLSTVDLNRFKPKKKKKITYWRSMMKNHFFRIDSTTNTGIIKIAAFKPYNRKTQRFYKKAFKTIEESGVDNLVIDLRDNLGGNIFEAASLLSYILDDKHYYTLEREKNNLKDYAIPSTKFANKMIYLKRNVFSFRKRYKKDSLHIIEMQFKPSKRFNYNGKTWVMTNGMSTSSSSYLAAYLKHQGAAIIVGAEAGGGEAGNNGGFYAKVELPNSKIKIQIPQYWLNYHLVEDKGTGAIPHYPITPKLKDVILKKDVELDFILERIKKEKEE